MSLATRGWLEIIRRRVSAARIGLALRDAVRHQAEVIAWWRAQRGCNLSSCQYQELTPLRMRKTK